MKALASILSGFVVAPMTGIKAYNARFYGDTGSAALWGILAVAFALLALYGLARNHRDHTHRI